MARTAAVKEDLDCRRGREKVFGARQFSAIALPQPGVMSAAQKMRLGPTAA